MKTCLTIHWSSIHMSYDFHWPTKSSEPWPERCSTFTQNARLANVPRLSLHSDQESEQNCKTPKVTILCPRIARLLILQLLTGCLSKKICTSDILCRTCQWIMLVLHINDSTSRPTSSYKTIRPFRLVASPDRYSHMSLHSPANHGITIARKLFLPQLR